MLLLFQLRILCKKSFESVCRLLQDRRIRVNVAKPKGKLSALADTEQLSGASQLQIFGRNVETVI